MSDEKRPAETSVFVNRPPEHPEDMRALCPWCGARIAEVDIHMDATPAGTVILTFRCKSCQRFQGHQVVPADWVVPNAGVEGARLAAPNVRGLLADMRNPRKGG